MTFGAALAADYVLFGERLRNGKARDLLLFFFISYHLSLELYFYMQDSRLFRNITAL